MARKRRAALENVVLRTYPHRICQREQNDRQRENPQLRENAPGEKNAGQQKRKLSFCK